jgi:type II restriction/modification system DNA methylase subunit YeeA
VLDPACGSGNFLYLALLALKDIEHRANLDAEAMGLERPFPGVGPQVVKGIELNVYAAELARVTVWIGEIQWMRRNGFKVAGEPVLKPLDTIECRDAVLNADGTEAGWPKVDAIIGNPPFLGGKRLRDELGSDYVDRLFAGYDGRVPAEADLVCYWFEKALHALVAGEAKRVGLVATNSIRGGANRDVLDRLALDLAIFEAWSDEPWIIDGAAVRVSVVCFAARDGAAARLDGATVATIHPDLTAGTVDLTKARPLRENRGVAFMGDTKGGAFDIPGELARQWLALPLNPNGRPNADVLRPWMNGMDVTRRPAGKWMIDFGWTMSEAEAALYQEPFAHVAKHVKLEREKNRREAYRLEWWRHVEPRPGMRAALAKLRRCIGTPRVAKHRLFIWLNSHVLPDSQIIVVVRDDDAAFGILHSRFHEQWALRLGSSLEDRPRYTPSTTFETFPFPEGLTPDTPASDYAADPRAVRIAEAARRLNELRENWLNPADLVRREPEVVPGFPDRIMPVDEHAAAVLKKRTLTNLYNERPAWLDHAHRDLDAAVAAAYGWPADIADDEALRRLFDLNQSRVA